MRFLWSAGESLDKENAQAFNCAFVGLEDPKDFADMMYLLMCGTGVGFSVEGRYISKLPTIINSMTSGIPDFTPVYVEDSREGWATAFLEVLDTLYTGGTPWVHYHHIRPEGAPLKTSGGRASGPEPLKELVDMTIRIFRDARGRQLNSLEVYDIAVGIANCVVAGGTRRSATISFSDLEDDLMKHAKIGDFYLTHPNRSLSNNSVVFPEGISFQEFAKEFVTLVASGTGERGIVFEESLKDTVFLSDRDISQDHKLNPCGEVVLRSKQFCNLSEIIVRPEDTLEVLLRKARQATLLGIIQSTFTNFNFIDPLWKKNTEEERLLGVSMTGLRDHPVLGHTSEIAKHWLKQLKYTVELNAAIYSQILGINQPKSVTSVKPSGTTSQLVDSASGLHPRYAPYYIRRIRLANSDPMVPWLKSQGVPNEPDESHGETTTVFSFYKKAPEGALCTKDVSAIEQLEYWRMLKTYYTTHNPSVTIMVKKHEWSEVMEWVWEHKPAGIALLPYDDHVYVQAPYEEITKEEYEAATKPHLHFELFHEATDTGDAGGEQGCLGGTCQY